MPQANVDFERECADTTSPSLTEPSSSGISATSYAPDSITHTSSSTRSRSRSHSPSRERLNTESVLTEGTSDGTLLSKATEFGNAKKGKKKVSMAITEAPGVDGPENRVGRGSSKGARPVSSSLASPAAGMGEQKEADEETAKDVFVSTKMKEMSLTANLYELSCFIRVSGRKITCSGKSSMTMSGELDGAVLFHSDQWWENHLLWDIMSE